MARYFRWLKSEKHEVVGGSLAVSIGTLAEQKLCI